MEKTETIKILVWMILTGIFAILYYNTNSMLLHCLMYACAGCAIGTTVYEVGRYIKERHDAERRERIQKESKEIIQKIEDDFNNL